MKLLGLIGYPLEHSFSPGYFAARFKDWGLTEYEYRAFPMATTADFKKLIATHENLIGLNVTIPHKVSIIAHLDYVDPVALKIGAVNTIKLHREPELIIEGYNTDAQGFINAYSHLLTNIDRALVLGTGGAAKAVHYALGIMGISGQTVGRSGNPDQLSYSQLRADIVKNHLLIVQATPVGMYPEVQTMVPFPTEYLTSSHIVIDLVYNPEHTLFMSKCSQSGAKVFNGMAMLEEQAQLSWKIWTGQ